MKTSDLSIKELAAIIGVSTDTIRRAARRGAIPSTRVGTTYRFDLRQVRHRMERNVRLRKGSRARRAARAVRAQDDPPPVGNTGALPTGIVTGGLKIR